MSKNKITKELIRLEVWFPGTSGSEEADTFHNDEGPLDYFIYDNELYIKQNGETIAIYNNGCWKRIYPTWEERA